MRTYFTVVLILGILATATGCKSPKAPDVYQFKTPKIKTIKLPKYTQIDIDMDKFKADAEIERLLQMWGSLCQKPASDQTVPEAARQQPIVIQDAIESRPQEVTDCEGKVTKVVSSPVRFASATIEVHPPLNLQEPVNFVEIESVRRCHVSRIDSRPDNQLSLAAQISKDGSYKNSQLGQSGLLMLSVWDGPPVSLEQSLITDGENLIRIRYYGKCLVQEPRPTPKKGDAINCKQAELLASQEILVDLQVERPQNPDLLKVDRCQKK